jgi:hypothetical protein
MTESRAAEANDFNGKIIAEFRRAGESFARFAQYEAKAAPRKIPVVMLNPVK